MIVAVHQPQYLPWLGYFDKIDHADLFVILDTVQYKKNEFQNRNRIKTSQGWQWLTVPVHHRYPETITEITINNDVNWRHKHLQALVSNYARACHFETYFRFFEEVYAQDWAKLADLNTETMFKLMEYLGISTTVKATTDATSEDPTCRLVEICRSAGAETYLSGAGGQDYLDLDQFDTAGISVIFQDYRHPEYNQLFGQFEPYMSVLDLLFNCGSDSLDTIRQGRSHRTVS